MSVQLTACILEEVLKVASKEETSIHPLGTSNPNINTFRSTYSLLQAH